MRAMADFNVRAEGNIILDSGSSIYMQAAQDVIVQAGKTIQLGSGTDLIFTAVGGQLDVKTSTDILIEAGAGLQLEADAGPLTLKASGGLNIEAGGAMTAKSSGSMNLQSSGDITEKSGGTILRSASSIKDNSGAVADTADTPSISPMTVKGPAPTTKMDVLNGKSATTDSITSRMPSHEPWVGHPKSNLPPAPSGPATLAQIAARQGGGSSPVTSEPVTDTTQTGTGPITTTNPNESQCATGVGTLKASNSQWATINAAASAKGIPPGNMMAMADVESQFKNGATSGTGARGLFQIVGGTWNGLVNQYGAANNVSLSDSPYDDNANAKMAAEYYNENQRLLVSKGITNPSVGEIYMTHLLGGSGGSKFIQAANTNPNMPISEAISSGALSSSGVNNNPVWFGGCATVGDAYNKINGTVNAKASQYGAQAGQPAPCDRTGASGTGTATSAAGASATSAPSPSASTASAPDNTTDSGTLTGGV